MRDTTPSTSGTYSPNRHEQTEILEKQAPSKPRLAGLFLGHLAARCGYRNIWSENVPKAARSLSTTLISERLGTRKAEVEQNTYQMPPQEGLTVAPFLTVADVERSLRFYETVFGGRILSRGDSSGAPGYIQIANTWLLVNPGVVRHPTNHR
jgi:hypothetical protein